MNKRWVSAGKAEIHIAGGRIGMDAPNGRPGAAGTTGQNELNLKYFFSANH
jgi:hypothetical protein